MAWVVIGNPKWVIKEAIQDKLCISINSFSCCLWYQNCFSIKSWMMELKWRLKKEGSAREQTKFEKSHKVLCCSNSSHEISHDLSNRRRFVRLHSMKHKTCSRSQTNYRKQRMRKKKRTHFVLHFAFCILHGE